VGAFEGGEEGVVVGRHVGWAVTAVWLDKVRRWLSVVSSSGSGSLFGRIM